MYKRMAKRTPILIMVFSLFAFSFSLPTTSAQVRDTDVILTISPPYPSSNENVSATLSSHSINLDKADITWSVNNQQVSEGVGKKNFLFTAGSLGSTTNLIVVINTIDGQSVRKTGTITPTGVDMLFQANDSYSPPFYKGRTLVGSQGEFKVVAMPNLSNQNGRINMNNLSYTWGKDGDTQTDSSGWGKNYLIFQNSYLDRGNVVNVKVSDITGGQNTTGSINLQTSEPQIIFYKNDPSLGVRWESALSDGVKIDAGGEVLVAEPYFFSPKKISSPDLSFSWFINRAQISTPSPKNMLAVKPNAGESGSAEIKVSINNAQTLFQSVAKILNVEF